MQGSEWLLELPNYEVDQIEGQATAISQATPQFVSSATRGIFLHLSYLVDRLRAYTCVGGSRWVGVLLGCMCGGDGLCKLHPNAYTYHPDQRVSFMRCTLVVSVVFVEIFAASLVNRWYLSGGQK